MIFRRLKAHIEKENWFAVFIDFAIVVIGVFIGIQVANWNESNAQRAGAEKLLVRLDEEVSSLLDIQTTEYEYHLPRIEMMNAVHALLFDEAPERDLTPNECRLIGISHWLPAPTDDLPALEEAIATGRLDLITDDTVRTSLRAFVLVRDRARRAYDEAVNELYRLNSRHPDAIWYVREPSDVDTSSLFVMRRNHSVDGRVDGRGFKWTSSCNLEEMRTSRVFLAEYVDNVSRLNSYIARYEQLIAVLNDLDAALAAELGKGAPS